MQVDAMKLWREALKAFDDALPQKNDEADEAAAEVIRTAVNAEVAKVLERAAEACIEQQAIFASDKYAVGQPLSSFGERFACGQCAEAIRNLKDKHHV